jgi:hypothetical protein
MSKTILNSGGITVRFAQALEGFRAKHGYWPDVLEAHPGTIATLATYCLTPLGFFLLQSKVQVSVGDVDLVARGRGDDKFDYGNEGWTQDESSESALTWLGLDGY